jgi:hypothetical protein
MLKYFALRICCELSTRRTENQDSASAGTLGDRLILWSSTDLRGVSFTEIETLTGSGSSVTAQLTGPQFNSLANFDSVSVVINDGESITIGSYSIDSVLLSINPI